MDVIISLEEFMQVNESHLVTIAVGCMVAIGGFSAFVDASADMGVFLYRTCKKGVLALYRKVKK